MGSEIIFKYFPNLSVDQTEKINALQPLYAEWNNKINVISRKDIDMLYERHVLHSLSIAKFIQFSPGSMVLDLGTGGGFPGVPLAILFPETHFHLVDAIGKKIMVVNQVASTLNLSNLTAEHQRAEKVKSKFDFIISRAVSRTKQLFIWTHQKIKNENINATDNGLLLLKGGDLREEMIEFGRGYVEKELKDYFKEEFFETKKLIYVPI